MNGAATSSAANKAERIAITGLGVFCVAGDEPVGAWSAAVLNLSVAAPDETTIAPLSNGSGQGAAMAAPIGELAESDLTGGARLAELVRRAAPRLSLAGLDRARVQLRLALPPKSCARRAGLRESDLTEACLDLWPGLLRENVHMVDAKDGVAGPLLGEARQALQQGRCDAVVIGAVDSLINKSTYLELNNQERLMLQGDASGIIPGEGGALLLLEPESQARARGVPTLALLSAVADAPEPHAGAADLYAMTGLPKAIESALAQAALAPTAIDGMVLSVGQEPGESVELYQTAHQIWPRRLDERQRLAVELDELAAADVELPDDPVPPDLRTAIAFGEVGAATLPLQLVLATEWLAVAAREALLGIGTGRLHLLVCETGRQPRRGAVIVSTPPEAAGA